MISIQRVRSLSAKLSLTAGFCLVASSTPANTNLPNVFEFQNPNGAHSTFSTKGSIDLSNAFFKSLGTNGRSCASCHQPGDGWSVTPKHIKERFEESNGLDPIFRTVDGSNCPSADVSSEHDRKKAYSQLLKKGLIRVSLPVPITAEFTVVTIDDPYSCKETTPTQLALFRRPLPSTNLSFLTTVMWDGRESVPNNTLAQNLTQQAIDATTGHAQGNVIPKVNQLREIVDFETALFTAQTESKQAGELDKREANGGPIALSKQEFFVGINDPLAQNPVPPFNPSSMSIFEAWGSITRDANQAEARRSVARGEVLFNTRPINITGVTGLNDALHTDSIMGTCTTCHNSPNVGNHSVPLAINIGLNDPSRRTPDMPLYTLRNKLTGDQVQTMDPGRAMITGKWADISKTKGPILRGLSSRAPYFHNGSAATLEDAVQFYEDRFHIGLSEEEKADLVAFLGSL